MEQGPQSITEEDKELPTTVTLLVRPEQSRLLARLEAESGMHLSLVFREPMEKAAVFIQAQDEALAALAEAETEAEAENEPADPASADPASAETASATSTSAIQPSSAKTVTEIMTEHDQRLSGEE